MFLLSLLSLGESRMYARRHHRREHIPEANFKFKPKCWEERTPYTEPLRIDRVDGNKETRTVYTPDLNSLNGLIAAKYPLIDLNQLKASNCAENSHQDIVGKRMNLRISEFRLRLQQKKVTNIKLFSKVEKDLPILQPKLRQFFIRGVGDIQHIFVMNFQTEV